MKILEKNLKQGEITVTTETLNDLWTLFNIISKNDEVAARTHRRIILKEGMKGERKPMYLKLKVEDVAFHEFSNRLRIKGTILEGPTDFVSFGSFHTFNLKIGQKIMIKKEQWFNHELKRLNETSILESNFIMLFIAIETGLATLSLITNFSQKKIARLKKNIPGKRYEQTYRNKALLEFFDDIKKIIEENVKNMDIDLIIICGPGNTREIFNNYLKEKSNAPYLSIIKTCHASSGTESAILEALKSKELSLIKKDIKILQETKLIEEILLLFSQNPEYVVIGINEVSEAAKKGAIKELLVADILIRGTSKENKLKIEEILNDVEYSGGKIIILSSEHPTGRQVIDLGSLIGILRYTL